MPGALEFVHYAMEKGVTVFYLSNRADRGTLDLNENGQIEAFEELMNGPLSKLFNMSKEELNKVVSKKILRAAKYTGTRNVANYSIDGVIRQYLDSPNHVSESRFKVNRRLNC